MIETKESIRASVLAQRRALDSAEVARRSELVISQALDSQLLTTPSIQTIGLYAAKSDEVQTRDLFYKLKAHSRHFTLSFPVVTQTGILQYFDINDWATDLAPARFGLLEPSAACRQKSPSAPDLLFVPGVAFSRNGHRLGYGKGHFDKTLAQWPRKIGPTKIGIAFDLQIVPEFSFEPTDIPMDYLVTESGCVKAL